MCFWHAPDISKVPIYLGKAIFPLPVSERARVREKEGKEEKKERRREGGKEGGRQKKRKPI